MSLDTLAASETPPGDNLLKSFISRFEKLEEERRSIASDTKDLATEAKGMGLDPAALKVFAKRNLEDAKTKNKREERENIMEIYASALGITL